MYNSYPIDGGLGEEDVGMLLLEEAGRNSRDKEESVCRRGVQVKSSHVFPS
jgi:hypothetical protein